MLYGKETPRIYTPPLRELTPETSYGFSVIDFASDVLGIELFPYFSPDLAGTLRELGVSQGAPHLG